MVSFEAVHPDGRGDTANCRRGCLDRTNRMRHNTLAGCSELRAELRWLTHAVPATYCVHGTPQKQAALAAPLLVCSLLQETCHDKQLGWLR